MDIRTARSRGLRCAGLVIPLMSAACAAGMSTHVEEPVVPTGVVPVERLAIMPATAEPGAEGLRGDLTRLLEEELRARHPGLRVLGASEAAERLSRSAAATDYAALLEDYERTGVVESARLERVADALGVDHFLQVRATYIREDFLDHDLFTRERLDVEERQQMALVARLWGHRGPGPAWEAVVRTTSQTNDFRSRRTVDELLREVSDAMARRVPTRASMR